MSIVEDLKEIGNEIDIQNKWIDCLLEAFKNERSVASAILSFENVTQDTVVTEEQWNEYRIKFSKLYPRFNTRIHLNLNTGVFLSTFSHNAFLALINGDEAKFRKWILSGKDKRIPLLPPKYRNWGTRGLGIVAKTNV